MSDTILLTMIHQLRIPLLQILSKQNISMLRSGEIRYSIPAETHDPVAGQLTVWEDSFRLVVSVIQVRVTEDHFPAGFGVGGVREFGIVGYDVDIVRVGDDGGEDSSDERFHSTVTVSLDVLSVEVIADLETIITGMSFCFAHM
jgi:hypothetical protein